MKKLLSIVICYTLYHTALGQEFVRDFGVIAKEDLEFKTYKADTEAEAVVLFDIGKSYFTEGNVNAFDIVFERHVRIKVLSPAGVRWADESIPFYRESVNIEVIKDLEGLTYNFENGRLTKTFLDPLQAYDEKVNENWTVKKFAMPDVREGSIIEYRYKLITPYKFNLQDWKFQLKIPVLYSRYEVTLNPFYEYIYILKGAGKFDEHSTKISTGTKIFSGATYKEITHFFGMKNIPAFRDEEFITTEEDYMMKLDFQLAAFNQLSGAKIEVMSTWPKLISDMLKHEDFGKFINKAVRAAAKDINIQPNLAALPPSERAEAIINYVKFNFTWNGYYSKYARKSVKELLLEKTGSAADLNLLMVALLKANGIDAEPVILSTRDHGKIATDYPFSHFFNYVIAIVTIDDKPILADATEAFAPFDNVPIRCINEKGLIIKEGAVNWVQLASNQASSLVENFELHFTEKKDSVICKVEMTGHGYDGLNLRKRTENKKEKIVDLVAESQLEFGDSLFTNNFQETASPFQVGFHAKTSADRINNKLYLSPFLKEPVGENPLKAKKRTFPIDMVYARRRVYTSKIEIPEGYSLEYAPEPITISNVLFSIDYKVRNEQNYVIVTGIFDLKSSVYRPEHYAALKEAYNKVVDTFNKKLVFAPIGLETGAEGD